MKSFTIDRAQALATLLPAVALTTPLLRGVPTSLSAAAGLLALASLPAALLLAFRRRTFVVRGLALLLFVLAFAAMRDGAVSDTFAARRATLSLASGLVLILSGASLREDGRALFVRGAALASIAWTVGAFVDRALDAERSFAGMLENTGDLSEAALPGAVLGLLLGASGRGAARLFLLAPLSYVVYVAAVPVHAGALSFLIAAILMAWSLRRSEAGVDAGARVTRVTILCGLMLAAGAGLRAFPGESQAPGIQSSAQTSDTGGVPFRLATWRALPALVRDNALLGVGPGQFEAAFPPYRDPADIESSTFGRTAPYSTVVEHAHNDWLEGFAEYGLIVGSFWLGFLVLVTLAALRALGAASRGALNGACGGAALAILINALLGSPLLAGVGSPALAFPLFGLVLPTRDAAHSRVAFARLSGPLAALVLVALAPGAYQFMRHGRALAAVSGTAQVEVDGIVRHAVEAKRAAVARALAFCPDSVVALSEHAYLLTVADADEDARLTAWERVVDRQPQRFEALLALGNIQARAKRFGPARDLYRRAAAVDAAHPGLLANALTLALDEGRVEALLEALSALESHGLLDMERLTRAGAKELLRGRPHLGLPLLERVDPGWIVRSGEEAFALADEFRNTDRFLLSAAYETFAHQQWAQEHVREDRAHDAVRIYRQALNRARSYPELAEGPTSLRMEFAAALLLDNQPAEARSLLEGLDPTPEEVRSLPIWAGQELLEAGLILRGPRPL